MLPEVPASGCFSAGFLGIPLSLSKFCERSKFPISCCLLLMQFCLLKLIGIFTAVTSTKIKFPICIERNYARN
jgi:hypothetical protein